MSFSSLTGIATTGRLQLEVEFGSTTSFSCVCKGVSMRKVDRRQCQRCRGDEERDQEEKQGDFSGGGTAGADVYEST